MKQIFCFCIAIVFVSCDSSTGPGHSVIMPLAYGNEWHYRLEHYDLNGTLTAVGPSKLILDTFTINGISGIGVGDSVSGQLFLNKTDGLYELYCSSLFDTCKERLLIPYPAYVGYSTIIATSPFGSSFWKVTIVSSDTLIQVPAGTFHCYKYNEDHFSDEEILLRNVHYYSPNRGRIYTEEYHVNDSGKWILGHRYLLTSLKLEWN